jgi:hypothetical protein
MTLPAMVNTQGELVRLITATDLLQAAGLPDDLTDAPAEALAGFVDGTGHLAGITREAKQLVSDELIRRMDQSASWTLRTGEFVASAPSPSAGTDAYDTERLLETLQRLVDEDVISPEAFSGALEFVEPAPYYKQRQAGIRALLKVSPVVREAVEACRVDMEPPRRTAKVKRA